MSFRFIDIAVRFVLSAALCAVMALFAGCNDGSEPVPETDFDSVVQIGFTVEPGTGYGARSSEVGYEVGTADENYIAFDTGDVDFLLFDARGYFVERLNVIKMPTADDTNKRVVCTVANKPDGKFKIMMLANWGAARHPELTPDVTSIEQMCREYSYNYTPDYMPSESTPIPMWGILTCDVVLKPGTATDVGTLELLRAMAKVEVKCKEGSGIKFKAVTLNRYSDSGYMMPGESDIKDNTDYVTQPNIPQGVEKSGSVPFKILDDGTAVIYIPEFRNIGVSEPCTVSVKFDFEDKEENIIRFCDYDSDGKPTDEQFDVLRNNLYRFIVFKMPDTDFEVDAIPFTEVEVKPDYGVDRENYTGYVLGADKEGNKCWYEKGVPYYFDVDEDGNALFTTINGTDYLLVYDNPERTPAGLNHFYKKDTHTRYYLEAGKRTGYSSSSNKWGVDIYYNDNKQLVWLDEIGEPVVDDKITRYIGQSLKCCRILYEWDRLEWNNARWYDDENIPEASKRVERPKYWFDVFGKRRPWSEGDTDAKRREILGEWVKYLE